MFWILYLFWEFFVCLVFLSNYVDLFISISKPGALPVCSKKNICFLKCSIKRAFYLEKYEYDCFLLCHIFFNFARIRCIKVKMSHSMTNLKNFINKTENIRFCYDNILILRSFSQSIDKLENIVLIIMVCY